METEIRAHEVVRSHCAPGRGVERFPAGRRRASLAKRISAFSAICPLLMGRLADRTLYASRSGAA